MKYKYFTEDELRCKCGCGEELMNPEFMEKIEALRDACEFPFIVTSGYRCPEHNQKVSSTGSDGPHTTGHALDISVSHKMAHRLLGKAASFGITGIGVSQKGDIKSRFIHLDDLTKPEYRGPRPHVWSY